MTADLMYKMCLRKKQYSWERAEQVRTRRFREAGVRLRTYFCPLCSHYHLTHLPYDGDVRDAHNGGNGGTHLSHTT